jgi:hydrogenase expression/formation protein HypD
MFGAKTFNTDDYRDPRQFERLARKIAASMTRPWTIMETSGEQTQTLLEYNLFELLPAELTIAHGPGCPVAAVPVHILDQAINIAQNDSVIFCASAELLRMPGTVCDLLDVKACGSDVRVVYSALDCINIARQNEAKTVVFFSVGLETAIQNDALAVWQARRLGVSNFQLFSYHAHLPAVCSTLLSDAQNVVNALLAPGQVCALTGFEDYEQLAHKYSVPVVITGFEPVDILEGLQRCVSMLEAGRSGVENQYKRGAVRNGNPEVKALINEVFEPSEREWRSVGSVARGGYRLKSTFATYDAAKCFAPVICQPAEDTGCISNLIWRGLAKPTDCPAFGKSCRPGSPLGSSMISAQGTCASYFKAKKETP